MCGLGLPGFFVCLLEASLNGQRLTLWGPLLGQRWEEQSGRGWGFSKSGNPRKSNRKLTARLLPTWGAGWKGQVRPSCCLNSVDCCSEEPKWGLCGEGGS